jgi:hypothetical protein
MDLPYPLNNPPLSDSIRRLKYIGSHLYRNFQAAGLNTLRELRDRALQQTKVQNTTMLIEILENRRMARCVGSPRFKNSPPRGYYRYCVRNQNKLAWYSIVTYLLGKGVPQNRLPAARRERGAGEQCFAHNRCSADNPYADLSPRFGLTPYTALDHIVLTMLDDDVPLVAREIWRRAGRPDVSSSRGFAGILRANSEHRGRKLFRVVGEQNDRPTYRLKPSVFRRLDNMSRREQLNYLRLL